MYRQNSKSNIYQTIGEMFFYGQCYLIIVVWLVLLLLYCCFISFHIAFRPMCGGTALKSPEAIFVHYIPFSMLPKWDSYSLYKSNITVYTKQKCKQLCCHTSNFKDFEHPSSDH